MKKSDIKDLISILGFTPKNGTQGVYFKTYRLHNNYEIQINFTDESINYGVGIETGDKSTSNFSNDENIVVLECVDRLLETGYSPNKIKLEYNWKLGHKTKGKLDILVKDLKDKSYLMIECKTFGKEYESEIKKMRKDGGQLFSYFQQDTNVKYLCLYTSTRINECVKYENSIIEIDSGIAGQKEVIDKFNHWNKNFKQNGIFENKPYKIKPQALLRKDLKPINEEVSNTIFNQFAEILRLNVVSDKSNAFNKIFNLFLCKIVDEEKDPDEQLEFQLLENESSEDLQLKLNDLYKKGVKDYLQKDVTDYTEDEIKKSLLEVKSSTVREQIIQMFHKLRLQKNNEFAFKEVFDEKSFNENAIVVNSIVKLLQEHQIRYSHKQQFLGDFFELLLTTGLKQETGQFFTPVPLAKFILSSIPIDKIIEKKISDRNSHILPYVIDYACGSGHFITESMDSIQSIIDKIEIDSQPRKYKQQLQTWSSNMAPYSWANEYIYGIDKDYRLVKTAKINSFLNGDGLANIIHGDGLSPFDCKEYIGKLQSENSKENEVFDVIVANPPYSVSSFKNTLKNGKELFKLFGKLTDNSSEIECLFIERTNQLLKVGGFAGIILPSTILNTNKGVYIKAREMILKHFKIKAICDLGSKTFMATPAHTSILFLEKRAKEDCTYLQHDINIFFENKIDKTINGVENPISKYVSHVWEGVSYNDYLSIINQNPNEVICNHEIYTNYLKHFGKEKDVFSKILKVEKEKLLYFLLSINQEVVIVKSGTKQAEKDFLGYEFSKRRGSEGIKYYRDENNKMTSKLYDESINLNSKKTNYYIYNSFLNVNTNIDLSLKDNIRKDTLINLIDFAYVSFEKQISITQKNKIIIQSKYKYLTLDEIFTEIKNGKNVKQVNEVGKYRVSRIESISDGVFNLESTKWTNDVIPKNEFLKVGDILFSHINSVEHLGKTALFSESTDVVHGANLLRLRPKNDLILPEFIIELLKLDDVIKEIQKYAQKAGNQASINSSMIKRLKLPIPPLSIQKTIVKELNSLNLKRRTGKNHQLQLRKEKEQTIKKHLK